MCVCSAVVFVALPISMGEQQFAAKPTRLEIDHFELCEAVRNESEALVS